MRRRRQLLRLAVLLMVAAVIVGVGTRASRKAGFSSLEALVQELAWAIEDGNPPRLDDLCHDPLEVSFERLVRQHAKLNYVTLLYRDRRWTASNSWKLGGHGFEYGNIHIDFVRQLDGKWYLKRIWGCR